MTKQGRQFLIGAAIVGVAVNLLYWLALSCGQPLVVSAIDTKSAASCGEFWLNRYQSMIAGLIALAGAGLTVMAMRHQTEAARADDAIDRLSAYGAGVAQIMRRSTSIEPRDPTEPDSEERKVKVNALRNSIDDPVIQRALLDPLLGGDCNALGLFMNLTISAAIYPQAGDIADRNIGQLVWPLYMELTNNLAKRRQLIIDGRPTANLFTMAQINMRKYRDAYINGSVVMPDV